MILAAKIENLIKDYVLKGETVHALRGVSFDVPSGDYVAIMGLGDHHRQVDLIQQDGVLQLPVQAIHEHGKKLYCMLRQEGGWKAREIEIGASNDKYVQISYLLFHVEDPADPMLDAGKRSDDPDVKYTAEFLELAMKRAAAARANQ